MWLSLFVPFCNLKTKTKQKTVYKQKKRKNNFTYAPASKTVKSRSKFLHDITKYYVKIRYSKNVNKWQETLQSVTWFRIPPDAHYDSALNSKQSRPQGRVGGLEEKHNAGKVVKMKTVFLPCNLKRSFIEKKKSFKPI